MKSFNEKLLVREEFDFPCNAIWVRSEPRKVCFFTWPATIRVILTTENLRKRKVVCDSWRYMCKKAGEDVDHLLLHCGLTMKLWWDMFR